MSHRCATFGLFYPDWCFAPTKEVYRFIAKRWTRRKERMAKHMPLSIFRHRPSAQVAPLQSLTLSVDIYNLTLAIIEVKHFYLSALHQSLDTILPVKHCNLKYEISQRYPSLGVNNGVHGQIVPGNDQRPQDCGRSHELFGRHSYHHIWVYLAQNI